MILVRPECGTRFDPEAELAVAWADHASVNTRLMAWRVLLALVRWPEASSEVLSTVRAAVADLVRDFAGGSLVSERFLLYQLAAACGDVPSCLCTPTTPTDESIVATSRWRSYCWNRFLGHWGMICGCARWPSPWPRATSRRAASGSSGRSSRTAACWSRACRW